MELAVQKLTQSAFAPYGEVLAAPETPGPLGIFLIPV